MSLTSSHVEPTTWRHRHASDWYGTCATGQEQSPIDIDTYSVIDLLQNEEFPLTEFHEAMTNGTLENDGHTVRFLPSQELTLIGIYTYFTRISKCSKFKDFLVYII